MLTAEIPTLVFLHFLGGSGRSWTAVAGRLDGACRCLAIDLPGFGDAASVTGYGVAEMADHVAAAVRPKAPRHWVLVGHSMGAKVAAVLARRAEAGEAGLDGLLGLVLLAGSPPGPEPIDETRRQAMMRWFAGDDGQARGEARGYVDQNAGIPLAEALHTQAVADVLRTNVAAWRAWLDHGSREDWKERIGVLQTPALLIAGTADADLGPDAQISRMAPHFASVRQVNLAGAGHLLPLERVEQVASLIGDQVAAWAGGVSADYLALIASARVSARTRALLLARAAPDDPEYTPAAMSPVQLATLRAALGRVVPQTTARPIDLAARIDATLGRGEGDGWRFARLPPDAACYRAALDTLEHAALERYGEPFARIDGERADRLLERAGAGQLGQTPAPSGQLSAPQMRLWFEDLRGDAVRTYVAHPATLARMDYNGIAYGGDGEPKRGFVRLGVGQRESWEPRAGLEHTA